MYLRVLVTIDHSGTVYHRVSARSRNMQPETRLSDAIGSLHRLQYGVLPQIRIKQGTRSMAPKRATSCGPSKEGQLQDMWQCSGPNSWTHAGKVVSGTSFNGTGGYYTEEDFKVGSSVPANIT